MAETKVSDRLESEMEDSIEITILDGKYSNYQSEIITFLTCKCYGVLFRRWASF